MDSRPHKILLVEPDPQLVELLVASLVHRFNAHVTCVAGGVDCLDTDIIEPHNLVISELDLPDMDGVLLADRLNALRQRPIILLADDATATQAIDAMRVGVCDMFEKPFPVDRLLEACARGLDGYELRRQSRARQMKLRRIVRRAIRERRDLHRRIELICRDLVGAHKRLVHRVADLDDAHAKTGG